MYTIWHNPRCSKSRQALALLEESGAEYQMIEYLKNPPSRDQIAAIIDQLGVESIDIVRTGESVWKESGLSKDASDAEVLDALVENPILIERPIVCKLNGDAIIGRPPERIQEIL